MYCTQCGKVLSDDQKYCDQCGAAVIRDADEARTQSVSRPPARTRRGWMWILVALAVVILVGGATYFIMTNWNGLKGLTIILPSGTTPDATVEVDASAEAADTEPPSASEAQTQAPDAEPQDPYAEYNRVAVGQPDAWIPAHSPTLVTWAWIADTEAQVVDFVAAVTTEVRFGARSSRGAEISWSEPREHGDYDGDGEMDYVSVWEWPIEAGFCDWEYPVSGRLTVEGTISDGWDEFSGEISSHEFVVRVGDPPEPTPMRFTIVNDFAPAGEIGQVVISHSDCLINDELFGFMDAIEIPYGSSLEVETLLPPGTFNIVFSGSSGPGRLWQVQISDGAIITINSDTAEMMG